MLSHSTSNPGTAPVGGVIHCYKSWEADLARRELRRDGVSVPIGSRAFDILEVLLEAGGQLVLKSELVARLWRGAFVEDNTLQVHVSAIRKALGGDRGLLRTSSGRGYALTGEWRRRQATKAPLADPALQATALRMPAQPNELSNLPLPRSELIGRAVAMHQIADFMSASRIVTLTGPGGIGKTRLALEVANSLRSTYLGDVRFVDLAALNNPRLVHSAVAGALGLEMGGLTISATTVAAAIGMRRMLLLLDNCEHVIDAVAALVEAVIATCPHGAVLTTSREALRIPGEHCFQVPPLEVPPAAMTAGPELLQHSAVKFLMLKVQMLGGGSTLDGSELSAVAAICRRLDGIPLALEFAAARVATLGAGSVLARLDERFDLLTGGRRNALPKQQTMRATLDWSYDLLSEPERHVLQVMSVFAAGCTPDAVAAVAQGIFDDAGDVIDEIANLIAKSLVTVDASAEETRWRLLETTRIYALEKLAGTGRADLVRRRHAAYFCQLIAADPDQRLTPDSLARYAREIDNVRAALDWAFSVAGDAALGITLTAGYVPVWLQLLLVVECTESIERALSQVRPDAATGNVRYRSMTARLHINLGFALLNTAGLAGIAGSVLAKGLELAESLGDPVLELRAVWAIWSLHLNVGRYVETRQAAERLLRIATRTGNRDDILVGHRLMGTALHFLGDQAKARERLEMVLAQQVEHGGGPRSMWFLVDQRVVTQAMLARVLLMQGLTDQAVATAESSLRAARETDDKLSICYALRNAMCPIALTIGDIHLAESAVGLLVDLVTRHGMVFWISWANCLQGQLEVRRGAYARGEALLRAGIGARTHAGWLMRNPEFTGALAEAMAAQGRCEEAVAAVSGAIAACERDSQRWCLPELRRIHGELLLERPDAAEASFAEALREAREQGALLWELRAAASLARLWVRQGRTREAAQLLTQVLEGLEKGADTGDARACRSLLAELIGLDPAKPGLSM